MVLSARTARLLCGNSIVNSRTGLPKLSKRSRVALTSGSTLIRCARQRCQEQSRGVRCSNWRDSDTGFS